jgi:hypothetical protein
LGDGAEPIPIHIGYHRTGSSWLQRHLFSALGRSTATGLRTVGKAPPDHPARLLIRRRWSEFDPQISRREFEQLFEPIRAQGLLPVVSNERLSGHAVSGGYDSATIAERLRAVFPEGRIVIVIREQRSAIVSNYKNYVGGGGVESLQGFLDPPYVKNFRMPQFDFRHFEYHNLIRLYQELFGRDAVLVQPYDEFVQEPRAFVAAIAEFAGRPLAPEVLDALPYDERLQRAPATPTHVALRALNRFARTEVHPAPVLAIEQSTLRRVAKSRVARATLGGRVADRREAKLRRAAAGIVGDRYAESNRITAELTAIELGGYGWPV